MTAKRLLTLALCLAFCLLLAGTALAQNKFQQEVQTEKDAVTATRLTQQTMQGDYQLVTVEELKGWMDDGKDILIVDTMPYEASYAKNHVPGAVQIEFPIPDMISWESDKTGGKSKEDFIALLGPDKEKTIVFYCGFVKCTRSHNGAKWARDLGYKNVYRFPGGIYAWIGMDYPVEKVQ